LVVRASGIDRAQSTLFPECLEDWIGEDNPVCVTNSIFGRARHQEVENGLLFTPTNLNKSMDVAAPILVAHTEAYEQSYRQRTK